MIIVFPRLPGHLPLRDPSPFGVPVTASACQPFLTRATILMQAATMSLRGFPTGFPSWSSGLHPVESERTADSIPQESAVLLLFIIFPSSYRVTGREHFVEPFDFLVPASCSRIIHRSSRVSCLLNSVEKGDGAVGSYRNPHASPDHHEEEDADGHDRQGGGEGMDRRSLAIGHFPVTQHGT